MKVKQLEQWPFPVGTKVGIKPIMNVIGTVTGRFSSGYAVNKPKPYNKVEKVKIVHAMGPNNKGGVTLAYARCSEFNNSNMVEVAVAYCSKLDTFSKKVGTANALEKFNSGQTVKVPARTNKSDYSIPENLRNMFWYSLV